MHFRLLQLNMAAREVSGCYNTLHYNVAHKIEPLNLFRASSLSSVRLLAPLLEFSLVPDPVIDNAREHVQEVLRRKSRGPVE